MLGPAWLNKRRTTISDKERKNESDGEERGEGRGGHRAELSSKQGEVVGIRRETGEGEEATMRERERERGREGEGAVLCAEQGEREGEGVS